MIKLGIVTVSLPSSLMLVRRHRLAIFMVWLATAYPGNAQEPPTRPRTEQSIPRGSSAQPTDGQSLLNEPPPRPRPGTPVAAAVSQQALLQEQPILMIDNAGFLGAVESVDFSPDGKLVAAGGEYHVRVWDVSTGRLVATLRGDRSRSGRGEVVTVRFSPDGGHLLVGVNEFSETGSLRVYRIGRWNEIEQILPVKNVGTRKLAFSRDGRFLLSADANGELHLWDWPERRRLAVKPRRNETATIFDGIDFFGNDRAFLAVEFDGYFVYSLPSLAQLDASNAPRNVTRWMLQSIAPTQQFRYPYGSPAPRLVSLRLDRDRWAAAGSVTNAGASKHWVAVWRTDSLPSTTSAPGYLPTEPDVVYSGHRWTPTAVALSSDAKLVASGDKFGQVHVWEAGTGRIVHKFEGEGSAIYAGHFSSDRTKIGFTHQPDVGQWRLNRYGTVTHMLDLKRRSIVKLDPGVPGDRGAGVVWSEMQQSDGRSSLERQLIDGTFRLVREQDGRSVAAYDLPTGIEPTVFSLVDKSSMGVEHPVAIGTKQGGLMVWDAGSNELRRYFLGHLDMVTATSLSDDGRLLLSSATDRTLRIWSLEDSPRPGIPDFKYEDSRIKHLAPESAAYRAGIRVGDVIASIDGFTISDFYDAILEGRFKKQAGELATILLVDGRRFTIPLAPGFDIFEPFLSLFIAADDSWIIWDQRGYYDCSPGADRLIGWHVGNGRDREASFYRAQQFQEKFYRPDVIDRLIATGQRPPVDSDLFADDLQPARPTPNKARVVDDLDLRKQQTLQQLAPPIVRFLSPEQDGSISDNRVTFEIEAVRNGDSAISRVYFLVNGQRADEMRLTAEESAAETIQLQKRMTLGPGRNRISLIAENIHGVRSDADQCQRVLMAPVAQRLSNAYVLAIGTSEYVYDGRGVSNLKYPAKDAVAFTELLRRHQPERLYKEIQTKVLVDEQATREGIIDGLEWLIESAQPDDVVFLFVAGHGQVDTRGQFYLIAHDTDPARKPTTGILFEQEINNRLVSQLPNCRRIVLLDTCHSGAAQTATPANVLVPLAAPHLGLVIYSSSDTREESFESDAWGHGAFTLSLLNSVSDEQFDTNGNAFLDTDELKVAIRKQVPILTNRRQNPRVILPPDDPENDLLEVLTEE